MDETEPLIKGISDPTMSESSLRQRKPASTHATPKASNRVLGDTQPSTDETKEDGKEEVTWGKTPSGVGEYICALSSARTTHPEPQVLAPAHPPVFKVPATHSFLHTMLTTAHRSSLTRLTLLTLFSQPFIFYLLSDHPSIRSAFFLLYFAFWRGAYDLGFAYLLRKQSEKKWIVRTLKRWGWLDTCSASGGEKGREWASWWKGELEMKMGEGYKWEDVPPEFNSWLIFRQLVDLVLLK
jgi:phosphatidylethanolamine N-methyltransferase